MSQQIAELKRTWFDLKPEDIFYFINEESVDIEPIQVKSIEKTSSKVYIKVNYNHFVTIFPHTGKIIRSGDKWGNGKDRKDDFYCLTENKAESTLNEVIRDEIKSQYEIIEGARRQIQELKKKFRV